MNSLGSVEGVLHLPQFFGGEARLLRATSCELGLFVLDAPHTIHGVEYYGKIGFLKAGLYFADRITTVSPTYASEILSGEGGMGLGGLLRERSCDLSAILNGVDTSVWDPATDPHIPGCFYTDMPSGFESDVLENMATNKAALQRRLGLQPAPDAFLLGVIGRLSRQKGLDLLLENLPTIVSG